MQEFPDSYRFQRLTPEVSAKPFFPIEPDKTARQLEELFHRWHSLYRHAEEPCLMWWFGDGAEILEFSGDLDQPVEWGKWLGWAEQNFNILREWDPEGESLFGFDWMYRPDAGEMTLRDVAAFAELAKAASRKVLGKEVRMGITFDPGNEFCKSDFRERKHPELLLSNKGALRCIDATARFAADDSQPFAGFPGGIPEGLPFGTFFGRQCRAFFEQMPFDFLWLSNSFGFGRSPYAGGAVGEFFDGEAFHLEHNHEVREAVVEFWDFFRGECPDLRVLCRGTDFSAGINMINQATPYEHIYRSAGDLTPPPNTPWAALTGNHGIALAGFMSQIAAYPGRTFPYRLYISDPWWLNSAWEDRYQRNPADVHLTMGISRLRDSAEMDTVSDINLFSIDTAWGEMPERFADDTIPHLKRALAERPTAAGPFVWVYPFQEFSRSVFSRKADADAVLAGDANIIQALNRGLPLSTVTLPETVESLQAARPEALAGRVLISPVPEADSSWESTLLEFVASGGSIVCYGSAHRASPRFLEAAGLRIESEIREDLELIGISHPQADTFAGNGYARRLAPPSVVTEGGLRESPADGYHCLAVAADAKGSRRTLAGYRRHDSGGSLGWIRGYASFVNWNRRMAAVPDTEAFPGPSLFRLVLDRLGWSFRQVRQRADSGSPARRFGDILKTPGGDGKTNSPDPHHHYTQFHISRNGFVLTLSAYDPDTEAFVRLPWGAPLLPFRHNRIVNGHTRFRFSESPCLHEECRLFVEQEAGAVLVRNIPAKHPGYRLRRQVLGLEKATVRYFPVEGCFGKTQVLVNPNSLYTLGEAVETSWEEQGGCRCLVLRDVTGSLTVGWTPDDAVHPHPVKDHRVEE